MVIYICGMWTLVFLKYTCSCFNSASSKSISFILSILPHNVTFSWYSLCVLFFVFLFFSTKHSRLEGTVPKQAQHIIDNVKTKEGPGAYWDEVEIKGDQFNVVNWPTVHWAGWFDIFTHGHLYAYDGFQKHSDLSGKGKC